MQEEKKKKKQGGVQEGHKNHRTRGSLLVEFKKKRGGKAGRDELYSRI